MAQGQEALRNNLDGNSSGVPGSQFSLVCETCFLTDVHICLTARAASGSDAHFNHRLQAMWKSIQDACNKTHPACPVMLNDGLCINVGRTIPLTYLLQNVDGCLNEGT